MEQRRLKTVLEIQYLLDQLGDESVRQDLKRLDASGSLLLTDADLASLDEFYKLVGPDRNHDIRYEGQPNRISAGVSKSSPELGLKSDSSLDF